MIMNKCEALRACEELRSKFPPFPLPVIFVIFTAARQQAALFTTPLSCRAINLTK